MHRRGWMTPALAAAAVLALAACAAIGFSSRPVELETASPAATNQQRLSPSRRTNLREVAAPGNMGVGQGKAGTAGTPPAPAQAQPTSSTPSTQATQPTPAARKVHLSQAIKMTEDSANKALARASKEAVQDALLQAALSAPGERTAAKAAARRAAAAEKNKPSAAWLAGERALGARDPVFHDAVKVARKKSVAKARLRAIKMGKGGSTSLAHEDDEEEQKLPYKIVEGHHRDDVYLKYHDDDEHEEERNGEDGEYVKGTRELGTPVKRDDVEDEWMKGAHNPGYFIHPRDRYVQVGGLIKPEEEEEEEEEDHEEQPNEEEEESDVEEASHEEGEGEEAESGDGEGNEEEPEERATTVTQLAGGSRSLNSPNAPTLEGGVSVAGGKVVWLPLNSLMSSHTATPAAAPPTQAAPVAPASAAPQVETIPMPQMPAMYSKVVAYGPNGKPDAVWYGSGQWVPAGRQQEGAMKGRQQQLKEIGRARQESRATDDGRGRRGGKLSEEDRAIERKVLFNLLKEEGEDEGATSAASAQHPGITTVLAMAIVLVLAVSDRVW